MSDAHGKFCWYELMTTDMAGAAAFYSAVTGWQAKDAGMPGMQYSMFSVNDAHAVAGLMVLPDELKAAGVPPNWTGFVAVDSVDDTAAKVTAAGGTVQRPPEDIPGVGRFAVVADPTGAVFCLFKDAGNMPAPAPLADGTPGSMGWHELYAGSLDVAWPFYSSLFGWTLDSDMDMGPMGVYRLFRTAGSPYANGGMMTKPAEMPVPAWLYYVNVDNIDGALTRINANNGKVMHGPHQVPGGSWIVHALDPQGAMFAVVGPRP